MRHAVILAGGSGTRLWPMSRAARPKQLLPLIQGKSLLELSAARLRGLFEPARTWVVAAQRHADAIRAALPELPAANVLGETDGRDTANAIGLAAELIARRDPDAVLAIFTADHVIQPLDRFQAAIATGLAAAERNPDALVTFGVTPTSPHTGYGYIETGLPLDGGVREVRAFREKPDRATAEVYLAAGDHLWNSGIFAFRSAALLDELQRCLPENRRILSSVVDGWRQEGPTPAASEAWRSLRRISIDFGVLERARRVLVVPMAVDWIDLGSWTSLAALTPADPQGNHVAAPRALAVDARGNLLACESEHLIVALGVEDLIVVHTPDVTLVARRGDAERVKDLVERVRTDFGPERL